MQLDLRSKQNEATREHNSFRDPGSIIFSVFCEQLIRVEAELQLIG